MKGRFTEKKGHYQCFVQSAVEICQNIAKTEFLSKISTASNVTS